MRLPLFALWAVLLLVKTAVAAPPETMKADFEWFDSLGYPDVRGLQFVKYIGGWVTAKGEERMEKWVNFGWFQADRPEAFTVLSLAFQRGDLSKGPAKGTAGRRYAITSMDFRPFVETELHSADPLHLVGGAVSGPQFPPRTYLFVLGWMCSRQGLDDLAEAAYRAAMARPRNGDDDARPFRDRLDRDLGEFELWNIILDFQPPRFTRAQLLARLQALPGRYPHCDHLAKARSMTATLEQMVREDAEHKAVSDEELAKLPPAAQVTECMFRLRDLRAEQDGQPGGIQLFFGSKGVDSTVDRLVALGDAAVPTLLAAQHDDRLTRSVGYGRDFFFSHSVMTIGEAVAQILEQTAGRSFGRRGDTMTPEQWWQERQTKGGLAQLSATTAAGTRESPKAGWSLLQEFPEQAAEPILTGARAAKDAATLRYFLPLLDKLKDDTRVTEVLMAQFNGSLPLASRAEVARVLARRGHLEATQRLAEIWREAARGHPLSDADRDAVRLELSMGYAPECYPALATELRGQPPAVRFSIVYGASGALQMSDKAKSPEWKRMNGAAQVSAATIDLIEALLGSELDDVSEDAWRGPNAHATFHLYDNSGLVNPRPADMAACILAYYWPEKYAYNTNDSFATRERQRLIAFNVYRAAHGLPPVAVPAGRPAVPVADRNKISGVEAAEGAPTEPAAFFARLREARGRVVDHAFYEELRQAFLEACAGQPPPWEHGLSLHFRRDSDGAGVFLTLAPGEGRRPAITRGPDWQIALSLHALGKDHTALEAQLFSGKGPQDLRGNIKSLWDQVQPLPADEPYDLGVNIVPAGVRPN